MHARTDVRAPTRDLTETFQAKYNLVSLWLARMAFCDKNSSKLFVTAAFDLFYALPEFTESKR